MLYVQDKFLKNGSFEINKIVGAILMDSPSNRYWKDIRCNVHVKAQIGIFCEVEQVSTSVDFFNCH